MGKQWLTLFWGVKITADGDCSHEIKRRLLLGRKVMTNLDNRGITLPTKVRLVRTMVFPVVMYGCESWTVKKAEHRRVDAFELWCWRRLLSPLDCSWWDFAVEHRELKASFLWQPRGVGWGGRWEGDSRGRGHLPMADSCWCRQKPLQYCIAIILQLKIKYSFKKWYLKCLYLSITISAKI